MPAQNPLASQLYIKLGGSPVQPSVLGALLEAVVDQHVHLPAMFTIRLHDPGMKILDGGPFDLTKEVAIEAKTADDKTIAIIKGEITALDPQFGEGMVGELLIRGYDKSHRLYRETKSKAL